jgi:oligopeptide transport system ATP-binding protein
LFDGVDLVSLNQRQLAQYRGKRLAMIFQDPLTSLNPFLTIGEQITEVTRLHLGHSQRQASQHAARMLERVGIAAAQRRLDDYPHQFSGGMRQRVMIAMSLACSPQLLIADEPTTALDVTIQAQILDLLAELRASEGLALMLITHDLGVIANVANRVQVMYAGRLAEAADAQQLFATPRHPYTQGLFTSAPRSAGGRGQRLKPIVGQPPSLIDLPTGCAFRPRCPQAFDRCAIDTPQLLPTPSGSRSACWLEDTAGNSSLDAPSRPAN